MTAWENPNLSYNSKKYFIENNCEESLCFQSQSNNSCRSLYLDKKQAYVSLKQKNKICKTGQKSDRTVKVEMIVALWGLIYVQ